MQRFLSTLALGGILWLLGGCGGGASAPNPGGNGNQTGNTPGTVPQGHTAPIQTVPAGTTLPNQVSVRTAASDSELQATLDKFGYSLLHRHGDFATVGVPSGNVNDAIRLLNKEFNVFSAEAVNVSYAPRPSASSVAIQKPAIRSASRMPFDPFYGEHPDVLFFNGTNLDVGTIFGGFGQGAVMNLMGFPGAWDTSNNGAVAVAPVRVAIIGAGFMDYAADAADIDPAIIDVAHSGRIDGAGNFTAGLDQVIWELVETDTGGGEIWLLPYNDAGHRIFQIMAARQNNVTPGFFVNDNNGDTLIGNDEVWAEGTAGINPNATYMVIRTGSASGSNWSFTDNELAAAINFAADPAQGDADIIVLSMAGAGAVGGVVNTAISNARNNNDALVIAPAGDVINSYDQTTNSFTATPVDIQVTPVTPASATDCVSVAATGFGHYPTLGDVTTGGNPATVPNIGQGWQPRFWLPSGPATDASVDSIFDTFYGSVAPYSNYNATLAACGFAIYYQFTDVFFNTGTGAPGDPFTTVNGYTYYSPLIVPASNRFSTAHATAYAAGTASMVYQALFVANGGSYPADVDSTALSILTAQTDFAPAERIDNSWTSSPGGTSSGAGLLNANLAMNQAISGGTLYQDPMFFTLVQLNQPLTAVTQGQPVQLTANIQNGTAPYTLTVDWGNGSGPQVTDPWTPGSVVSLPAGYGSLGPRALNVSVEDAVGQTITARSEIFVINPLTGSIVVTEQSGSQVALSSLNLATNYIFELRASNLYTGTFDHDANPATPEIPNTTVFQWDFDSSGGAPDATGTAPVFAYTSPGNYTITITVQEAFRPDQILTVNVTVQ